MNAVIISLMLTALCLAVFYIIFKNRLSISASQKKALEHIEGEVRSLVIEMNNTTDRNIALIEDRINELKTLIDQADKRITVLKKEHLKENENKLPEQQKVTAAKNNYSDIKRNEPDIPLNIMSIPKKKTFKQEVLELHNKGFEPKIISQKMEANIGEVELIISLAKGKAE
jgi:hypothetical protein